MTRLPVDLRRAFTLVELLVSLAIIAVLLSLLLPAIQKVREAANRLVCGSNLRQIALAVHAYEADQGRIPYSTQGFAFDPWDWDSQRRQRSWSWLARLLPYIEQGPLYQQGNIPHNTFEQSQGVLATPIKLFFCPSDSAMQEGVSIDRANLHGAVIALSNYKGVCGSNWWWHDWAHVGSTGNPDGLDHGDGVFYRDDWKRPLTIARIRDGASNTFLAGEDIPSINAHCTWPYANGAHGTCAVPPNVMRRPNGEPYHPYFDWPWLYSFRSRHPGGLQFAFADGSIRFINDSIPLPVYRGLATINGGEAVSLTD